MKKHVSNTIAAATLVPPRVLVSSELRACLQKTLVNLWHVIGNLAHVCPVRLPAVLRTCARRPLALSESGLQAIVP